MPVLLVVEYIQAHYHTTGRLRPAYIPVPAPARRHSRPTSDIGRLLILPYGTRPLYALAGSHSPAGHYGGDGSPSPAFRVDISLRCPQTITTDQGRQFESQLFHSLAGMCSIHLSRMTAFHPAGNGLVERMHRSLKAAIMCQAQERWPDSLPLVLLGMRTAFKEDLQASVAELVYGETLRIPGELLTASPTAGDPSKVITQLRRHFEQLRPVPAARHASPAVFIHKDLADSTHVFLRQDTLRRPLDPPYSGPHKVLARTKKTLRIVINGQHVTVSTGRVKPACVMAEPDSRTPAGFVNEGILHTFLITLSHLWYRFIA